MKTLIGIHGKSGHGKDTAADFLIEIGKKYGISFRRESFGHYLRILLSSLVGIPYSETLTQDQKKNVLKFDRESVSELTSRIHEFLNQYEYYVEYHESICRAAQCFANFLDLESHTIGRLLQYLGTEVMRDQIDQDVWIKIAVSVWRREECPPTLIPDVRFPNEEKIITENNGVVFRMLRKGFVLEGRDPNHLSETAMDHLILHTIENPMDSSLEDPLEKYFLRVILCS